MKQARHIAIEGPIGVGKSSLVRLLAERLSARIVLEPDVDNPFLEDFYREPRKFAFQTQLFFLLARYQQQSELAQMDLFAKSTVADYLFEKDRIFAYLNLSEPEIALYEKFYEMLSKVVVKPDLVVYMTAETKVLLKRIKRRNRSFERRITHEYLDELVTAYSDFFFAYSASPLLVVNTSQMDFVHNEADFEALVNEIITHERGVKHFIPVSG